ncbi:MULTISPECIES: hypothetical protein [unclassified Haladaptatus]|uniref:hypothetical protein n=1 Tax=unclassified Haladaptatus TaxID=2622732 RepID=UPI00209C5EF7|nr:MULTISPECIES: hypothetical protein [unclassified Haladaptatus]MCO8242440.1 hypothetical protein [Haladaptatus sp. AB643]MCO8252198.1 hypothetical protein [Haladaptatus sp. AB618]
MNPRVKASLLWGVVGALAFLVLLQGYQLVTGYRYSVPMIVGTTLVVAIGAPIFTYIAHGALD